MTKQVLQKLQFVPGINRERTRYANEGTYWDCDKIRFQSGMPQKIGGWTNYKPGGLLLEGVCRTLFSFGSLSGIGLTFIGTSDKTYIEIGGVAYDVTPIAESNTIASNAFTTDTGEPGLLQINDVNTIATTGSTVILSGVTGPVNGVPESEINGEHYIVSATSNSFKIAITTAPSSSGTTGAVDIDYVIPIGGQTYTAGFGWGTSTWGSVGWGSPSSVDVGSQLRLWNVAQYGEALVFGPRGGPLCYWEFTGLSSLNNRGTLIAYDLNANEVPLFHNDVLVSDQSRFVVTIGSNDYAETEPNPMLVRWSDQENYLEWEPRSTTQAGSIILSTGSELITLRQSRQEILVWSDIALYSMQYIGPPIVFGFNIVADNISIMGPKTAIVVDNITYWMGRDKFYVYTGRVEPLPCSVRRYVFDNFNYDQAWQACVGVVRAFSEVWWFYPSKNAVFNDRYVVFNYTENCWYYGKLGRTAWLDSGLKELPIATDYDSTTNISNLYYHEFGVDDNTTAPSTPIHAYIETADFDIDDGTHFALVKRILPDLTFEGSETNNPSATFEMLPRRFSGADYDDKAVSPVTRSVATPIEQYTEQVFVRYRGRQMAFKISSTGRGVTWQLGAPRIDVRLDGRK